VDPGDAVDQRHEYDAEEGADVDELKDSTDAPRKGEGEDDSEEEKNVGADGGGAQFFSN